MSKHTKQTILITGGSGGIGLCTAKNFTKKNCNLILSDINKQSLNKAIKKLKGSKATVHTYVVDVTKKEQVETMAKQVLKKFGHLDILINNAGIGYNGELAETPMATWKKLIEVNLLGPLYHVYAFLPSMIKKRSGHIVNVSSGQAFFRLPTWGAYAAVKIALGAFSETLHYEIKKYNINVTTVYPFMVNTGFYDGVKGETWGAKLSMKLLPYYAMSPEKVGKIIFEAIGKKKNVEMVSLLNDIGFYTKLIPPVFNFMSSTVNYVLAKDVKEAA